MSFISLAVRAEDHSETAALSAEILDSDNVGEVEDGDEIGAILSEYGWETAL